MKLIRISLFVLLAVACSFAQPARVRNHATATHHTIKVAARPFKALGHGAKKAVVGIGAAAAGIGVFSWDAFDTTVVDPFGVALQAFADGVDMFVAAPLESLPKPLNEVGVGVHFVYEGIDWAGTQLAK